MPPSAKRAVVFLALIGVVAGLTFALQLRRRGGENRDLAFGRPIDQAAPASLAARRATAAVGERAMQHCRELVALGPRYFGQPGWSKQLDYIVKTLGQHGLAAQRDTWTDRRELITFSNVSATIPGDLPGRVLLACHHDTKCTTGHPIAEHNFDFVGANDGASGVGLLLALAPVLKERRDRATVELVFFDGEESLDFHWNDSRALFGSKRFVRRHLEARARGEEPAITGVVLLDMVGRVDLHIQEDLYSDPELRRLCWSAAFATGHEAKFFRVAEAAKDDHVPFLRAGIPAIDLIDLKGNPYWHTRYDTLEFLSADSLRAVADVVLTMIPNIGPR
ncbi:MAG: M28 family metallopeptidase [Planctomycetota bacterium]|nr:M28 family metallopeptidase [Planctomycetota bacterium]